MMMSMANVCDRLKADETSWEDFDCSNSERRWRLLLMILTGKSDYSGMMRIHVMNKKRVP